MDCNGKCTLISGESSPNTKDGEFIAKSKACSYAKYLKEEYGMTTAKVLCSCGKELDLETTEHMEHEKEQKRGITSEELNEMSKSVNKGQGGIHLIRIALERGEWVKADRIAEEAYKDLSLTREKLNQMRIDRNKEE